MKDSLCFIDTHDLRNDKSYSNLGEFFLRSNAVCEYMTVLRAEGRVVNGNCSDLDLLREFIKKIIENQDCESKVAKGFFRVLDRIVGVKPSEIVDGVISADELWKLGYESLSLKENSLHGIIKKSGLSELGVAVNDNSVELPGEIENTKIRPIICPVPSLPTLLTFKNSLEAVETRISELCADKSCGAVILDDLEFEEPNQYVAAKGLERLYVGAVLKERERAILKSQLLRRAALSFGENGGELMMVLPSSSDMNTLYHLGHFIDYIDEERISTLKIVIFASDLVGYSFAVSEMAKFRKKITVEAAISGNDCTIPRDDEMRYWSGYAPRYRASLAHTAAGLL